MNGKKGNMPLQDKQLVGITGGVGIGSHCGLQEEQFPKQGKCFEESRSLSDKVFSPACPYCKISGSLPEGENLEVGLFFECIMYGFVKRQRE